LTHPKDFYLFELWFNVSLSVFQSCRDVTCVRQIIVLPLWNAFTAGTCQVHPYQLHYPDTLLISSLQFF